ncbi:hypothetical protein SUGI_0646540 [Cryptomeria japonica]|nr:hypothetical protein SUGI_0646540 [Cryptomeria japonica]
MMAVILSVSELRNLAFVQQNRNLADMFYLQALFVRERISVMRDFISDQQLRVDKLLSYYVVIVGVILSTIFTVQIVERKMHCATWWTVPVLAAIACGGIIVAIVLEVSNQFRALVDLKPLIQQLNRFVDTESIESSSFAFPVSDLTSLLKRGQMQVFGEFKGFHVFLILCPKINIAAAMNSLSRELVFLVLQFLNDDKFKGIVHTINFCSDWSGNRDYSSNMSLPPSVTGKASRSSLATSAAKGPPMANSFVPGAKICDMDAQVVLSIESAALSVGIALNCLVRAKGKEEEVDELTYDLEVAMDSLKNTQTTLQESQLQIEESTMELSSEHMEDVATSITSTGAIDIYGMSALVDSSRGPSVAIGDFEDSPIVMVHDDFGSVSYLRIGITHFDSMGIEGHVLLDTEYVVDQLHDVGSGPIGVSAPRW